jgi:hypothetical protein
MLEDNFVYLCLKMEALQSIETSIFTPSGFGGTQDRGFEPDRSRRVFPIGKIHSKPSFGGEVK